MLLTINSDQGNFSYQIGKSPVSPPRFSSCRGGFLVGWFGEPVEETGQHCNYHIAFVEGQDNVSFGHHPDEFEFLSMHRYTCPLIPMRMIADFFSKTTNGGQVGEYGATIESIAIKPRTQELIKKYFAGIYLFPVSKYSESHVRLELSGGSLDSLLSTLDLICLISSLDLRYYVDVSEAFLTKYFNKIAEIDAPYFFRYLMKTNLVRSGAHFELVKDALNASNTYQYALTPLSNQNARMKLVEPLNGAVLDIGCGEGSYLSKYAKNCTRYVCVDKDEEMLERAKKKAERKCLDHCEFYTDLSQVEGHFDHVLCMEVLEHIEMKEVPEFLGEVNKVDGARFIFSSPNSSFNSYYQLEDCERHEDHKWEVDRDTFFGIVKNNIVGLSELCPVGDLVNGETPTTGVIVCRDKS